MGVLMKSVPATSMLMSVTVTPVIPLIVVAALTVSVPRSTSPILELLLLLLNGSLVLLLHGIPVLRIHLLGL